MIKHELQIEGCFMLNMPSTEDERGSFDKIYFESEFQKITPNFTIRESYINRSKKNVIRGMHFQEPPHDHYKLVKCISGRVTDVFLDLRINSSTYGMYETVELNCKINQTLFLPKGIAHGFRSLEDNTQLLYMVSSEYNSISDKGIRYNSFGFDWSVNDPILSDRDRNLPSLIDYKNPF